MRALVYLRMETPVIRERDLAALADMYAYCKEQGYEIVAAWPVRDPWGTLEDAPSQYYEARKGLKEGLYDVLVLWNPELFKPVPFFPADIVD